VSRVAHPRPALAILLLLALAAVAMLPLPAGAQTTPTTAQPEVTAAQAGAGVLLSAEDRVELAQALAEATEESEICFGYLARLNDAGAVRQDAVSSLGPNQRVTTNDPRCPKGGVELQVDVEYTCGSCESDDRASWGVVSNVGGVSSSTIRQRLEALTGLGKGDLLGDKDDQALRNATAALPLAVSGATVEPAEPSNAAAAPNGDRVTGSPGSDWVRENGLMTGIGALLLLVGLGLLVAWWISTAGKRRIARLRGDEPHRPDSSSNDPASS
jgi:hypothetical protein